MIARADRWPPAGDTAVVAADDRALAAARRAIEWRVDDALAAGARTVVVDLAAARHLESAALGVLVSLARRVRARGAAFRVANANADLRALFALTRLDAVLAPDGADGTDGADDSPAA